MGMMKNLICIHFTISCALFSSHIIYERVEGGMVDVESLGYNGTWDDFCNNDKIDADFVDYSDHDLKRFRLLLCQFKSKDNINRDTLPAFGAYKYCSLVRPNIESLYRRIKGKFEGHFQNRIAELPASDRPTAECYTKAEATFHRECVGKENPCIKMFQALISSTCVRPGISTEDICRYLVRVCDGKYLSDKMDWELIYSSLNYKD